MDVEVRQISAAEVEAAADLFIQVYASAPWHEAWSSENAKGRLRELSQTPGWLGTGAFKSGKLVGLSLGVPHTSSVGKSLFISELIVSANLRQRGIGTRLIGDLQKLAQQNGFYAAWLVSQSSGALSKFYKGNGYNRSKHISVYSLKFANSGI